MDFAYQGRHPPQKLAAMVASHLPSLSQSWYSDTGVTHHVTSDLDNLSIHTPYHGSDTVQVRNGAGLSISNTGTATLHTPNSKFSLRNVLHCPNASANLLSVPQFSRDNQCYFCFDDAGFCVKDKASGKMLFKGPIEQVFTLFKQLLQIRL